MTAFSTQSEDLHLTASSADLAPEAPSRWQTARRLAGIVAGDPELLAAAKADPVAFVNGFCFGKDFERGIEFKAKLWPWQERFLRHLAGIEPYDAGTPFRALALGTRHLGFGDGLSAECRTPRAEQECRIPNDAPARCIVLKARGVGGTWALIWYAAWLIWARPPAQVLVMSDIEEKAIDLADRRFRFATEALPAALGFPAAKRGDDNKAARSFLNGGGIISLSGDPDNIHTYHPTLAILDEASRYRTSFLAAITGLQSQVVVISTANGFGNDFARVWADAANNRGQRHRFVPIFVPWTARPSYTHKPTGDPALQAQEYPETAEEAFLTSGRPYFDLLQARQLAARVVKEPLRSEDGGQLKIWTDPTPGRVYGIFADTAKGLETERDAGDPREEKGGPDYSVAIVADWMSGEQVAEWHGRPREFPFAHTLYALWKRYPGVIVPERNGPGEIVCQRLKELDPSCVFFDRDGRPGWMNTEQTRRAALALLYQAVVRQELVMRSAAFWREVDVFMLSASTGRPEAAPGYHDDRVLARAMCEVVRTTTAPPAVRAAAGETPALPVPVEYEAWDRGSFV